MSRLSLDNFGNIYHPRRPLWVVMAHTDEEGGIDIIASRDITDVEIEIREDPWAEDVRAWGDPSRILYFNQTRPRVTIDMRGFEQIRGPHLRAVLEGLYRRWAPTPDGRVNG